MAERGQEGTSWLERRAAARGRGARKYDAVEARAYGEAPGLGWLSPEEESAYLHDLRRSVSFQAGARVLDVGAGTGVVSTLLQRLSTREGLALELTALEPSEAMLAILTAKPELSGIRAMQGSSDDPSDRDRFEAHSFDAIVSRQVVNGLFDPLLAFRHWYRWLKQGGAVVVLDGLYGRDGWTGRWAEEVDVLPLSASQSMASTPYLLEACGFHIEVAERMTAVDTLPTTRTPRYLVVARKRG